MPEFPILSLRSAKNYTAPRRCQVKLKGPVLEGQRGSFWSCWRLLWFVLRPQPTSLLTRNFLFGISDGSSIQHKPSFWSDLFRGSIQLAPKGLRNGSRYPLPPGIGAARSDSSDSSPSLDSLLMDFSSCRAVSTIPLEPAALQSAAPWPQTAAESDDSPPTTTNNSGHA